MSLHFFIDIFRCQVIGLALMLGSVCTACTVPTPSGISTLQSIPAELLAVRQGRYTLVELAPDASQRDLLEQIIEVSLPSTANTTVGDALHHILLRTGYRLCEARNDIDNLIALPLPAAHLHLGPIILRDALLTLAGPAWDLSVDNATRQICFKRREDTSTSAASRDATSPDQPEFRP